ncbi:2-amino-4-hydroxy-6-hydroxymethyldihydropteridine diphosphokinase [Wenxinia saemankumensis]|uniref:2-amino-4-hydroxy-6- hydroxymethyldihydropteridine diphosphokinase n=1 Tax=Wenxinia saemankumensis TaxID=1447782 RepID=UPI001FCD6EBE|nr:2-amino-4-hydroxy-6-hydroxymethyldihydropteridine diphosphokinase [Wenxinia saemankumensis]
MIALGSNMGTPDRPGTAILRDALGRLSARAGGPVRQSALWRTPAYPAGIGPDFLNAVVALPTRLGARALLDALHRIEAEEGRVRKARWGPRPLDLDLIALDDAVHPDAATLRHWIDLPVERQATDWPDRLLLPHPRLQDRAFVLIPMAEVAPDWRHPLTGLDVDGMIAALPPDAAAGMARLDPAP